MQADVPDDPLVRETIAALGPGAKDATLDDLAAWIRQLEELCASKDSALAPATFRTDISGSCLSKFPSSGTAYQITMLQTKPVKGYPPLPELHMEKVSSKKKNARGETKLRLSVERGPVLVLLTITDLDGATRTLRAVTENDNDLIPITHPATTIEATVVSFAPDQLLERLRRFQAKLKPQQVQPSAPPQQSVKDASAPRQADGVEYTKTRHGGCLIEQTVDRATGTVTVKSTLDPYCCDKINYTGAPSPVTLIVKNGQVEVAGDDPRMHDVLAPVLKNYQQNIHRVSELRKRTDTVLKEEKAIKERLPTAKPAEKKRLLEELEAKNAEYVKLTDLLFRTGETGGWMGAPREELLALLEKAKQNDPKRFDPAARRSLAALNERVAIQEKLESTSNQTKRKRLAKLLARKEIEYEGSMNEIAVIADLRDQEYSKELNDVSTRMNEASVLDESP